MLKKNLLSQDVQATNQGSIDLYTSKWTSKTILRGESC